MEIMVWFRGDSDNRKEKDCFFFYFLGKRPFWILFFDVAGQIIIAESQ